MVRWMQTKGLSQRRALEVIRMSVTVLRYQLRADRNTALRASIVELAQRHRRYGVGMIYLKLRQRGECVNYKRVEQLYRLEKLQVQRRKRKKRDLTERHPLGRPNCLNEV
jgi:transposase InsO family protein